MEIKFNKSFYNRHWKYSRLFDPIHWGHWALIKKYKGKKCLEIGAGTRPRIPIKGNYFLDISAESLKKLEKRGGITIQSDMQKKLPFEDNFFDLICCFETLEHVPNDGFLLKEMARLVKQTGTILISVPIHMSLWTDFDKSVGHYRRYELIDLPRLIKTNLLQISKYAFLNPGWPGKKAGKLLKIASKYLYPVIAYIQDWLDLRPNAQLTKVIELRPFKGSIAEEENMTYTTLFLVLKKIKA